MKLASRFAERMPGGTGPDIDPRETASAEVIDLASRTAYPTVARQAGKSDTLGLLAGVAFVALLGAATWWGLNAGRTDDGAPLAEIAEASPPPPPATLEPSPLDGLPSANAGASDPRLETAPEALPGGAAEAGMAANPYNSPALVFDGSRAASVADAALAAEVATGAGAEGPVVPGGGAAGDFAARIGGVGGGPALARQDINPTTTIATGTMIPAVLETAINTDVPGYVRAVVSQDVKSFDGSRVLVPRSSRLVGQYQSGLQAGQTRAYVIWTRLIRPDGVSVQLASPATTFDGTAGLEGDVDRHFFSRFGSAMLLSVIGGLTAVAAGGAQIILGGGQNAASTALEQDGQRSPTVRVRMGEPVRVYTARDLDFSLAPQVQ